MVWGQVQRPLSTHSAFVSPIDQTGRPPAPLPPTTTTLDTAARHPHNRHPAIKEKILCVFSFCVAVLCYVEGLKLCCSHHGATAYSCTPKMGGGGSGWPGVLCCATSSLWRVEACSCKVPGIASGRADHHRFLSGPKAETSEGPQPKPFPGTGQTNTERQECIAKKCMGGEGGSIQAEWFGCGLVDWVWTGLVNPSSIVKADFMRAQTKYCTGVKATSVKAWVRNHNVNVAFLRAQATYRQDVQSLS